MKFELSSVSVKLSEEEFKKIKEDYDFYMDMYNELITKKNLDESSNKFFDMINELTDLLSDLEEIANDLTD